MDQLQKPYMYVRPAGMSLPNGTGSVPDAVHGTRWRKSCARRSRRQQSDALHLVT